MKRYDRCLIKKTQRVAHSTTKLHQENTAGKIVKDTRWWSKEKQKSTPCCQNQSGITAETSTFNCKLTLFFLEIKYEGGKSFSNNLSFTRKSSGVPCKPCPQKSKRWKLGAKTFFPQRAPKSVWSGNKKRKKNNPQNICETAASRPRSAGQRTPAKKKKNSWRVTMLTDKCGSKAIRGQQVNRSGRRWRRFGGELHKRLIGKKKKSHE